jgi:hypothetical protein
LSNAINAVRFYHAVCQLDWKNGDWLDVNKILKFFCLYSGKSFLDKSKKLGNNDKLLIRFNPCGTGGIGRRARFRF